MSDRLLDEAARMLRGMEERFGIPAEDIETPAQGPRSGDNTTSRVSTRPAGSQQADRGAA